MGAPVADLERRQCGRFHPDAVEESLPGREPGILGDVLADVACHRHGLALVRGSEEDLDLDGREVLDLVQDHVSVLEGPVAGALERTDAQLVGTEQEGVVLRVEAGVDLVISIEPAGDRTGLVGGPTQRPVEGLVGHVGTERAAQGERSVMTSARSSTACCHVARPERVRTMRSSSLATN